MRIENIITDLEKNHLKEQLLLGVISFCLNITKFERLV